MSVDAARLAQLFGAESVGRFESGSGTPGTGLVPALAVPVLAPASLEAAAEALRFACSEHLCLLPAGAGEHLYLGAPPGRVDLVLSTRRLQRVVEYEPEDMTLVAEAGVTLHAIETLAAPHGQRLAPDPWPGRAATLGGAVAANRAGLDRLRYGTPRDIVLGMRVLHADGRASKTGGKVVKNVAGFDLSKLYAGSLGSLVLLGEINVRLSPRPRAAAMVTAAVDPARVHDALLAVHRSALQPSSLLLVAGHVSAELRFAPHRVLLVARFEGGKHAVRWQVEECLRLVGGSEVAPEAVPITYESLRLFAEPEADSALLRIASLPTAACDLLGGFSRLAGVRDGLLAQFGVGTTYVRFLRPTAAQVEGMRAHAAVGGARVVVEHAPPGLELLRPPAAAPPPDGAPWLATAVQPATLALARDTKALFDPESRLRPACLPGDDA